MSVRKVQLRRGTGAENDAFTGAVGEITVNTTNNSIRVHDGATLGGSETALANLSNVLPTQNLDFDEYRIVNAGDPVDPQDVATKNYVDTHGGGGGGSLATLSDVDVAGVDTGEFLKYSGTEWINTTISTADLQDGLDIPMMVGGTITANLDGNAVTSTAWISAMTLNLTGTVLTGSVAFDGSQSVNLNASLNDASVSNAKLENSSVRFGSYDLALGGTLALSNDFQITGGTLSLVGGGGATAISDLTDVNINLPADGNVLTYNNGIWENHVVSGDATLSATGTLILNAIDNAKLINSTINIGGSPIALGGTVNLTGGLAITGNTLSVGNVDTATKLFTAVTLSLGGSVITGSVSFDGSQSVEIIADVTPESITNGMIANSTITNAKLEHDFIAFNNHEVHLGEGVTINGTDGEISVAHNAGVYTIGLAGTIVATSAVALAKTINLAGNATGSVSLDNALASVTLNVTLGTITNAMLEHDFISVNDFQLHLSDNLDVVGADGVSISLDENTSILTVGLGTISTTKLSSNFITIADSDSSENITLGGTLSFLGVANETSVFVLNGEVNVGLANDVEIQGNLTIGGSLIVNGTTTSINTVNLDVVDSIVLLGKGTNVLANAVNDAGFIIERGNTEQSASLFWDENSSRFAIVTADSIGSSTTNIVNQASNLSYADLKLNSLYANAITGSTLSIFADAQLTVDSAITFNDIVNLKDVEISSTSPVGYVFQTIHDTNQTFVLNSDTGNIETVGNITVQGDLYASNIIESANGAGITLQDTTSVNANLDVYNPTGALINGTTVYLYVKYGADSIANGEYFHIFKTNDGGSIRQVVPLTFLQDGGQNKLAIKAGGIYEYQAVAGAYTNAGNAPNASFVLDTEGGAYTYQIRAYTNNDDGVEFEVAFSTDGSNNAPVYSILYNANDGSAYNSEYLIVLEDNLDPAVNAGAISTFNQTEKALSVNSSNGNVSAEGSLTAYGVDIKNASGNSILATGNGDVYLTVYGAGGNTDGFYINGGTTGNNNVLAVEPNNIGGDGQVQVTGQLQVWNGNDKSLLVTKQANTTLTGGDFLIQDTNLVESLKLTNATGVLQARELSSFAGGTLTFSGTIVTTTQTQGDNSTKLATTEYVDTAVANGGGGVGLADNNTWTGTNAFQNDVTIGGGTLTFSVQSVTNANILVVNNTDLSTIISSDSPNALKVTQSLGNPILNVDGDSLAITSYVSTDFNVGEDPFVHIDTATRLFEIVDALDGTLFSVNNAGDVVVAGDLTVNGTTTTIDTTNLNVTDNLIELAHGIAGVPTNDAGFVIARGDEHNASLFWNEASDTFIFATSASINSLSTGNLLNLGGTLSYASVRMGAISLVDNNANALDIKEGNNSYLNFVTTNGSEKVVFSKPSESPQLSKVANFTFYDGYIESPNNISINPQGGLLTLGQNAYCAGYFQLGKSNTLGESNNVGVRFDYFDSPLIDAPNMTTGQEYIIQTVGDTDFTLVGAGANSQNIIFTVVGDASVLLAGTTGKVYPTASAKTGFFGHDKSSHVFTMYNTYSNEATLGDAKFNDLTLANGLLVANDGTSTIILNSGLAGNATTDVGITVNRGNYTDAKLLWDETANRWSVSTPEDDANVVNPIAIITANPSEGARYGCSEPIPANEFNLGYPSAYQNKMAYFLSNGGNPSTVNLFDVLGNTYDGFVLALFNTDSTATITVDGSGAQTIGGSLTKDIPAGGCLTIMAFGGAWYIM